MKKLNLVLSVLVTIFLSVSLVPPASAHASPLDVQISYAGAAGSKVILVKIVNNTNRYIDLTLDHRTEYHLYNLSVAPGVNQYYLYSGPYKYMYTACGNFKDGTTTFKRGSKLRIGCAERKSHDD